jgi:hypothetical protein
MTIKHPDIGRFVRDIHSLVQHVKLKNFLDPTNAADWTATEFRRHTDHETANMVANIEQEVHVVAPSGVIADSTLKELLRCGVDVKVAMRNTGLKLIIGLTAGHCLIFPLVDKK